MKYWFFIVFSILNGTSFCQKTAQWRYDAAYDAYSVVNTNGNVCTPYQFQNVIPFGQNLAAAYIDTNAFLVRSDGIPTEFLSVSKPHGDYLHVQEIGTALWGVWKDGKLSVPCAYKNIGKFVDAYAFAQKDDLWVGIDYFGKEPVLKPKKAQKQLGLPKAILSKYDAFGFPNEETGLIRVRKNGKWGWVDGTGNEIINCIFDASTPFIHGAARVMIQPMNREIVINTKGEMILGQ